MLQFRTTFHNCHNVTFGIGLKTTRSGNSQFEEVGGLLSVALQARTTDFGSDPALRVCRSRGPTVSGPTLLAPPILPVILHPPNRKKQYIGPCNMNVVWGNIDTRQNL